MRRINSLEDAQLVLNDLLNFKSRMETGAQNLKGNRVMNVGAGSADSDAATVKQLNDAISGIQVPDSADVPHYKTITWSLSGSPSVGATLPPFCITTAALSCFPHTLWVAVNTAGTANLTVDLLLAGTSILNSSKLTMPKSVTGPVSISTFNPASVKFGVGSIITPTVLAVGGQIGITIGLVVRRSEKITF